LGPIGRAIGLLPRLNVFKPAEVVQMHRDAGFEIDVEWQPGYGKAVFLVAKKPV
jgi:hypothetical protein